MKRFIALAAVAAALPALAQQAAAPRTPAQEGYFRPSDLATPAPPLVVTQPTVPANAAPQPRPALAPPDAIEEVRRAEERRMAEAQIEEERMDLLERQNERARLQQPATINGAFTGLTDERNR